MKKFFLFAMLFSLALIGCSSEIDTPTQSFKTKSGVSPTIVEYMVEANEWLDENPKETIFTGVYGEVEVICKKAFTKTGDHQHSYGAYENHDGIIYKVTVTYKLSTKGITKTINVEPAGTFWDCNDLIGEGAPF